MTPGPIPAGRWLQRAREHMEMAEQLMFMPKDEAEEDSMLGVAGVHAQMAHSYAIMYDVQMRVRQQRRGW